MTAFRTEMMVPVLQTSLRQSLWDSIKASGKSRTEQYVKSKVRQQEDRGKDNFFKKKCYFNPKGRILGKKWKSIAFYGNYFLVITYLSVEGQKIFLEIQC